MLTPHPGRLEEGPPVAAMIDCPPPLVNRSAGARTRGCGCGLSCCRPCSGRLSMTVSRSTLRRDGARAQLVREQGEERLPGCRGLACAAIHDADGAAEGTFDGRSSHQGARADLGNERRRRQEGEPEAGLNGALDRPRPASAHRPARRGAARAPRRPRRSGSLETSELVLAQNDLDHAAPVSASERAWTRCPETTGWIELMKRSEPDRRIPQGAR
jgi:hypothetical protein